MELLAIIILILAAIGITGRSAYLIGYSRGYNRNRWPNT